MIRENTGNFSDFGCPGADLRRKYLVISGVFFEIPYSTEQGILKREQGIILLEQGISWEQQGSRFQFHSTGHPGQPRQGCAHKNSTNGEESGDLRFTAVAFPASSCFYPDYRRRACPVPSSGSDAG
jgi:hypothetical protein